MQLRKGMIVAVALAAMPIGARLQAAPQATGGGASAQQVRELMDVVGTKRLVTQMMSQMTALVSKAVPCVPQATLDASLNSPKAQEDLVNRMIPVYQQHFSSTDIQGLMTFYRSPLGQKVLGEMPAVMQAGMQVGQQWGAQRAQAMVAQLQRQGVLDAQGACPAPKQPPAIPAPGKH